MELCDLLFIILHLNPNGDTFCQKLMSAMTKAAALDINCCSSSVQVFFTSRRTCIKTARKVEKERRWRGSKSGLQKLLIAGLDLRAVHQDLLEVLPDLLGVDVDAEQRPEGLPREDINQD